MYEMGWFIDRHVELIAGEIIEEGRMTQSHWVSVNLAGNLLPALVRPNYCVSVRSPLNLGADSEPRPDIAVCAGGPRDYLDAMPTTAALIIEAADFTIVEDRHRKGSLYARAGAPDYWIVNLRKCILEVYREPVLMRHKPFGYGYEKVSAFFADETVSPLAMPETHIAVSALLP